MILKVTRRKPRKLEYIGLGVTFIGLGVAVTLSPILGQWLFLPSVAFLLLATIVGILLVLSGFFEVKVFPKQSKPAFSIEEIERFLQVCISREPIIREDEVIEKVYANQKEAEEDLKTSFHECKEKAKILVVRGSKLLGVQPSPFFDIIKNRQLSASTKIQVLFLSPGSKYLRVRAGETGQAEDTYKTQLEASIRTACRELAKKQINLIIGLYDCRVIWRFFIFDNDLFLGTYPPKTTEQNKALEGEEACILKIRKNKVSEQLYTAFECLFDDLEKEFEKNDKLRMQLCKVCTKLTDERIAKKVAQEYIERIKRKQGGCFECQS
jgi:hypothetical protein